MTWEHVGFIRFIWEMVYGALLTRKGEMVNQDSIGNTGNLGSSCIMDIQ